ncbi:MAG: PIN domain-containing protein [Oscillospiraceae bacterium]|nr:PIN domain-containing protein [Oscillospiraceae bacterium]
MKIFLIDFENVHSEGLAGVDSLTENDEVVIFHSINADTITFEMMHKLMFSPAKLSYYKVRRGGRNALDFQMSTYLGYLINVHSDAHEKTEFYLISRDAGFDFVIDFWASGNIDVKPCVKRFFTIKAVFGQTKTVKAKQEIIPKDGLCSSEGRILTSGEPVKMLGNTAELPINTVQESVEPLIPVEPVETAEAPAVSVTPSKPAKPIKPIKSAKRPVKNAEQPEPLALFPVEAQDETKEVIVEQAQDENKKESAAQADGMDIEVIKEVDKLLSEAKSSHELYIGTVKRFGQKKGVEIYRNIKAKFSAKKTG